MLPTFKTGDEVMIDENATSIRAGDVIWVDQCVHRVCWIDPFDCIWECGDALEGRPVRRTSRDVRGKVVSVLREGQWLDVAPPPYGRWRQWSHILKFIVKRFDKRMP